MQLESRSFLSRYRLVYTPAAGPAVLRLCSGVLVGLGLLLPSLPAEAGRPRGICGNGVTQIDEQCDDGNILSGDGCSLTCQVEVPPGCTAVAAQEVHDARAGDVYFDAMLRRAEGLGYDSELQYPIRCSTATGGELYSAVLVHGGGQSAVALQSRDDVAAPFGAVLLELAPGPEVVLHFGDGTIVGEQAGTPQESLTVLDLDGNVLAGGSASAASAALAAFAPGASCDDRLGAWAQCLRNLTGSLLECSFGVLGAVSFCTGLTGSSAGLGFWICAAFATGGAEYLNPGACASFMPIAQSCDYPIGDSCSEPPNNCGQPKRCEYRSANPFQGAECLCPFELTGFNEPVVAIINQGDPGLEIFWDGQPDFPVTAEYWTPDCPPLWFCPPDTQTFWDETNPIEWADALGCDGPNFGLPRMFDTEFVLRDSAGQSSETRTLTWTCAAP